MPPGAYWQQINIDFTGDRAAAEHHAITTLGPAFTTAEDQNLINGWFFIRKSPWRMRYLPAGDDAADQAAHYLYDIAVGLWRAGHAKQPTRAIYEPETRAFGGTEAMTIAHQLFHADSRNILTHVALGAADRRRETSLLLCTALMRGAGQDRFERGDIWDKVRQLRTSGSILDPAQWDAFKAAVTRLITVDVGSPSVLRTQDLGHIDPWLTAFETTGHALRRLADSGKLMRGLRAVLAHHVIFHWNRIGILGTTQAHLARAATQATFDGSEAARKTM